MYADTRQVMRDVAALVRPPPRRTIAETARLVVRMIGGVPYDPERTHYMIEPAACVTSRQYQAVVFVGPAQSGKTQALVDNTIAHVVTSDPQDIMIIQTAKDQARDFSKRRVDRMHLNCPEVGRQLATGDSDDNTFDKTYRSGMILSILWPSRNITAGKAVPIVIATDYDRVKDDAGGEGSLFDVLLPRTRTFKSRGMLVCESSPSRDVLKPGWKASTPHEAPPTKGILGLFNSGDRRRHYCRCQHCLEYWMPDPSAEGMSIPREGAIEDRARGAGLVCGTCGAVNGPEHEVAVKRSFVWLREGEAIDTDGVVSGTPRNSRIASFWMPGYAAKYSTWEDLALSYLRADEQFDRTGEEEALEAVVNTGFGAPYMRKALVSERSAQDLLVRAEVADEARPVTRGVVPEGARCLIATIDNQKHSFVVQVHAFGVDGQCWIIDRYSITEAETRRGEDGERVVIQPATYPGDFEVLRERVLEATYPTEGGQRMRIRMVGQDLSGTSGVSENVYAFFRDMRRAHLARDYRIVRGGKTVDAPVFAETFPDRTAPGAKAAKRRGDVPVVTLNITKLKDKIDALIGQEVPGENHIHLPAWADLSWYEELLAEVRGPIRWDKIPGRDRNETLDLLVYALGLWQFIGGHKIDWEKPPTWAAAWEENSYVEGAARKKRAKASTFVTPQQSEDPWLR